MRHLSLALAGLLLVTACGGSSDPAALTDSGMQSLRSGSHAAAEADFEKALAAIGDDTAHAEYKRAAMGAIQARVHTNPAQAKEDFLALRTKLGDRIDDRDYQKIANALGGAGQFAEAIALLAAGKEAYPSSTQLDKLGQNLAKQAKAAGDASATSALAGLGYVGD